MKKPTHALHLPNPATLVIDHYRITEIVHRCEASAVTLTGFDNVRTGLTVCVHDANDATGRLRIGDIVKAKLDFSQHLNHQGGDCTLIAVRPVPPRLAVYCIPTGELMERGRITAFRMHRFIGTMGSTDLADLIGGVIGHPQIHPGYFAMPAMKASSRHGMPGGLAMRAVVNAEMLLAKMATLKQPTLQGEILATAALLKPVPIVTGNNTAGDLLTGALVNLKALNAGLYQALVARL